MPEIRRSANLSIQQKIDLPMSPPVVVIGYGKDGQAVCQVALNATGITISGPKGGVIRNLYWEQLVDLARS